MNRRNFLSGLFALPVFGLLDKLPNFRTQRLQQGIVNAHLGDLALTINKPFIRRKDGQPIDKYVIRQAYEEIAASDTTEEIRAKVCELWPELMQAIDNPPLHQTLAKDGLEVNPDAIQSISDELGIHLSTSEDNRLRISQVYSNRWRTT